MTPQQLQPGTSEYDNFCKRLALMFGDGLAAQITNEEYLVKRGMVPDDTHLKALRRARDLDRALKAREEEGEG